MRDIKFRGKTKIDNIWVIGSYFYTDDNKNDPFRRGPFKEKHQILFYSSGDWNLDGWNFEEVDKETVGQFTGLKDKNGKEIYEGDILTWSENGITSNPLVVEFKHGAFGYTYNYEFVSFSGNSNFMFNQFDTDVRFEVIGNIHDNPELNKRFDDEN